MGNSIISPPRGIDLVTHHTSSGHSIISMVQQVIRLISHGGPIEFFFCSSQCSTTGVTKATVCAVLYVKVHIKDSLLLIRKSSPCSGRSRCPMP